MTDVTLKRLPNSPCVNRAQATALACRANTSRPTVFWNLTCLSVAILLPGHATGQQSADAQMPQALKAPSLVSLNDPEAQSNKEHSAHRPTIEGSLKLKLQQAEAQDADVLVDENGILLDQEGNRLLENGDTNKKRRDTGQARVQLSLGVEQALGYASTLVGRVELSTLRYSDEELTNLNQDEEFSFDLERLYLKLQPSRRLRLRAGRQGIKDPMETILDEDLDGLLLSYKLDRIELSVSYTQEDWFYASTLDRVRQRSNTMLSAQFSPSNNSVWMPYALHRSDAESAPLENTERVDRYLFGVQALVDPADASYRYWLHASMQSGEESSDEEITDLGGFAIDLGANWTASGSWKPTFTFAAAHASGGNKPERYRQSGLHSNDFALNGKNKFRYLGEVLDPELTNIQILTLGMGLELPYNLVVDVALHAYKQVELENALRGSDIEYLPATLQRDDPVTGELIEGTGDADLGSAIDLIVAYQPNKQMSIKASTGRFIPGGAFANEPGGDERKHAWIAALELEYSF